MNILYCGDRNIENGLIISLMSIADYVETEINVYVMTMELETEKKKYEPVSDNVISELDKYLKTRHSGSFVRKINITALFHKKIPDANINTRFTPYCMLRLFADLVPELPDKILYLDNDVICRGDLRELYYINMKDYEVAGVLDYYGKWFFRNSIRHADYINSGVLLINLEMVRKTGLFKKCREMCSENRMFMPDQSAINRLAVAKRLLPRRYNEQRKLRKNTLIQHFTTSFRFFPWVHIVSVKPWEIEKMHEILKLNEYDELLERYLEFKRRIGI